MPPAQNGCTAVPMTDCKTVQSCSVLKKNLVPAGAYWIAVMQVGRAQWCNKDTNKRKC